MTGREVFRYDLLIIGFLCVLFLQIQLYTDSPFFLCLLPLFSLRYPFEVNGLNLRKRPKATKHGENFLTLPCAVADGEPVRAPGGACGIRFGLSDLGLPRPGTYAHGKRRKDGQHVHSQSELLKILSAAEVVAIAP